VNVERAAALTRRSSLPNLSLGWEGRCDAAAVADARVAVAQVGWWGQFNELLLRLRDWVVQHDKHNAHKRKWASGTAQQGAYSALIYFTRTAAGAGAVLVWCPHRPSRRHHGLAWFESSAAPPLV
jgi:hypothetical protein